MTRIPQTLFDTVPPAGFLEITVNGSTLSRRRRFGSVAYAFHSGSDNITSVNAVTGSKIADAAVGSRKRNRKAGEQGAHFIACRMSL